MYPSEQWQQIENEWDRFVDQGSDGGEEDRGTPPSAMAGSSPEHFSQNYNPHVLDPEKSKPSHISDGQAFVEERISLGRNKKKHATKSLTTYLEDVLCAVKNIYCNI